MRPAPIQSKPTIRSAIEESGINAQDQTKTKSTLKAPSKVASSKPVSSSTIKKQSIPNPLRSAMRGGRASHAGGSSQVASSSPTRVGGKRRVDDAPGNSTLPLEQQQQPTRKKARISDVFQRKEISDYGSDEEMGMGMGAEDQENGEEERTVRKEDKGKGKEKARTLGAKGVEKENSKKVKSTTATNSASTSKNPKKSTTPAKKKVSPTKGIDKPKEKKYKSSLQSKLTSFVKDKLGGKSKVSVQKQASTSKKTVEADDGDADDTVQSLSSFRNGRNQTSLSEMRKGISENQRKGMLKRLKRVISLGLERGEEENQDDEDQEESQSGKVWISKDEKKMKRKLNDADVIWSVLEKGLKEAG